MVGKKIVQIPSLTLQAYDGIDIFQRIRSPKSYIFSYAYQEKGSWL